LTSTNQRRRNALDWITSVALIGAAGVVIWSEWPKFGPGISPTALAIPKDPVELGRRTLLGSQDAPTLLVEFTDVECPFCATFARDTLPEINRLFVETGRLAVALVSLPLAIHTHARDGARALECADEQAKLWPLATLLFRIPQGDLSAERIRGAALAAGVEPEAIGMAIKNFVYLLRSTKTGEPYTGLTTDFARRLAEHNAGQNPSTARGRPWALVVLIEFTREASAVQFERYLKSGSGRAFAKRHLK